MNYNTNLSISELNLLAYLEVEKCILCSYDFTDDIDFDNFAYIQTKTYNDKLKSVIRSTISVDNSLPKEESQLKIITKLRDDLNVLLDGIMDVQIAKILKLKLDFYNNYINQINHLTCN